VNKAVTKLKFLLMMTSVAIASWIIGPLLVIMTLCFIFRIILTWYPQIELTKFPWILIALPTEPFLAPTRKIIPPPGGVDITPIIWVGILSLLREILLGQQGLLRMMM
jgi:YggT family protein